jgi:hypothetical protein
MTENISALMGAAAVAQVRERAAMQAGTIDVLRPTQASAKVDLVADMKRRHGIVDEPSTAKAAGLRVDIVADMKRRHGMD